MLLAVTTFALAASPALPGDLTITEFQADTDQVAPYYGEWFEVYNNSGVTLDLQGVSFTCTDGTFTVDAPLEVAPSGYAVFAVSDETVSTEAEYNGGVTQTDFIYDYFSFNIALSADFLEAEFGGVTLDRVEWTSAWSTSRDQAMQASLNAYDLEWANDFANNWCVSTQFLPSSMKGSPGSENDYCSVDPGTDTDGDGYTEAGGDCNDDDPTVNPGEIDDGQGARFATDDDCDGVRDDGELDDDNDGYTEYGGGVPGAQDCDDADSDTFPGAVETPDGLDNDCNDCIDDVDRDNDGYGSNSEPDCTIDCDETDNTVYPGAPEVPYDGIDQDCDGYDLCDVDNDGYKLEGCQNGTDCDDADAAVHPGAIEDPINGVDDDCDGEIDIPDRDGDGVTVQDGDCMDVSPDEDEALSALSAGVYPGAQEVCGDLLDNDCDGLFDNLPECASAPRYASVRGGGVCGVVGADGWSSAGTALFGLALACASVVSRRRVRA